MAAPMPRVPPVSTATRAIDSSLKSSAVVAAGAMFRQIVASAKANHCCTAMTSIEMTSIKSLPTKKRRQPPPPAVDLEILLLAALHAHGDAHAAADAQRGEAFLGVALRHFVEQRHQDARAGCADRMTERDRTAIDVDLARVPAEVLVDRAGLGGEGLVGLDEVEVLDLPAGLLERGAGSRNRAGAHDRRIDTGLGPGH